MIAKPEVKDEIKVLNKAYELFSDEHQGRRKWIDTTLDVKKQYFRKARKALGLPDDESTRRQC